jgi:hypothetical protein
VEEELAEKISKNSPTIPTSVGKHLPLYNMSSCAPI